MFNQVASSSLSLEMAQACRHLTFSEVQLATQDFDESLIIGRGGFGKVYKGSITNGESLLLVAIKRLDSTSNQGAVEFWAEVEMLSKLRHCHLVSLIGYCNDQQEMILVYEYMPNGTLEDHLHKLHTHLPWVRRLKICIGYARGLDYLHTGTGVRRGVIHRDVKSSNMLLDYSWTAKISDFGLSKVGPTNQQSTYVNTSVKGTFGYLDPDYFTTGRLTRKSDVYAFGVVLLEVLCRKSAVDRSLDEEQWGLASWALESVKEGRLKQIVDSNIRAGILPKCLKEFARLAEGCLHSHPKQRPTMAEVVVSLQSILVMQEKAVGSLNTPGMKLFGRKMPMFLLPSNRENSVGDGDLRSLESYLNSVVGDVFYRFDHETIRVATANFSEANTISQSRFSSMYKGKLHDGQGIAIALHSSFECQRLINEVSILLKLQHENLVSLLGYCTHGTKVFIIYEFAPYATMYNLISDAESPLLDWNKRYTILLGVARVLLYLHKLAPIQIIHANVTPSCILLDESLNPKLSDFELAATINNMDCIDMHTVCGTWLEYLAPEYLNGCLSTKADVYSFGMLILKTISGYWKYDANFGVNNTTFLQYAWRNWWEGTYWSIVDPRIDADSTSIRRLIHIGLLCVQADAADRPSIEHVDRMLLATSFLDLPVPKTPQIIAEDLNHTNAQVIESDLTNTKEINLDTNAQEVYDSGVVEEFILELILWSRLEIYQITIIFMVS